MNVNSGGPHILLFERDQQLTALLMSEFQLAGYECHAARTAVEVFDAIARHPIRLVLVNLAQAAAGRREFWVALDAQRRGRGVQVLTFRCANLAGYGPDDPEERSRSVLTDIEVDGMLGVMSLVDAVRSRIPAPGTITGSFSRLTSTVHTQEPARPEGPGRTSRQAEAADLRAAPQISGQATAPLSLMTASPAPTPPGVQNQPPASSQGYAGPARTGSASPTFTDRMRAVIYPANRSYSVVPETNQAPPNLQSLTSVQRPIDSAGLAERPPTQAAQRAGEAPAAPVSTEASPQEQSSREAGAMQGRPMQSVSSTADGMTASALQESGLAQLSRMVHENKDVRQEEEAATNVRVPSISPSREQEEVQQRVERRTGTEGEDGGSVAAQQGRSADTSSPGEFSLRASPIEDVPVEREQGQRSGRTGPQAMQVPRQTGVPASPVPLPAPQPAPASLQKAEVERVGQEEAASRQGPSVEVREESASVHLAAELSQAGTQQALRRPSEPGVTSEDMLLNIVRSLPAISSPPTPPPQPPVLSGRATRSLGSVLLDGHLVPKERLEVAQNIQRMLRGVDMNYQLGEILLMFKLLTPDQLLAASLLSYGLIAPAQISALGRIRQELHAIGLEYDLESLLVLFRILTPEQLREVRASWSG